SEGQDGSSVGVYAQRYALGTAALSVQSIVRTNPAGPLTGVTSVTYAVTFSESVTGVDAADFSLALTGTVATTGLVVTPVSGSVYAVTISGITGNGTLRLDLNNNGSIQDLSARPLSAGGIGQSYTIDQILPAVSSFERTSPAGPYANSSVTYTVSFAEPVT